MSSVSKSAGAVPVHKSKAKAAQTRRGLLYALPDWLMIIVLFFSQGIMGDKELTFEGIGGWLKKHKKSKPVPAEKEG